MHKVACIGSQHLIFLRRKVLSSSDSFLYKHQNHKNTKNLVPETCDDNGDVFYKANGDDNEVDDKEGVVGEIIDSKNKNICSDSRNSVIYSDLPFICLERVKKFEICRNIFKSAAIKILQVITESKI